MATSAEVKAGINSNIRQKTEKNSVSEHTVADAMDTIVDFAQQNLDDSQGNVIVDNYAAMLEIVNGAMSTGLGRAMNFFVKDDEDKSQQFTAYEFFFDKTNPSQSFLQYVRSKANSQSGTGDAESLMTIGDSITNQAINNTGTTTLRYSNQGWWVHTLGLLRQPLTHVFNAAVSGYTAAQVLADLPAQLKTYRPKWCWGIIGQNNLGDADIAPALQTLTDIAQMVKKSGAKLLLGTVTPRTTMVSPLIQNISAINAHLRKLEAQGLCYLFDAHAALLDITSSTGISLAATQYDNIHPNALGALRIGWMAYNRVKNEFPVLSPNRGISNADNRTTNTKSNILSLNPKTIGTSGTFVGGGSGQGATSWVIGRSAGSVLTATASKESTTNIYRAEEWQKIDFGGVISAQETIRFQQSVALTSFSPVLNVGDKIVGNCKIRMSGLSANFYNVRLAVEMLNSVPAITSSTIALADSGLAMVSFHTDEIVLKTQPVPLVSGTVNIRLTVYIDFVAGTAGGSISLTDAYMEYVP